VFFFFLVLAVDVLLRFQVFLPFLIVLTDVCVLC